MYIAENHRLPAFAQAALPVEGGRFALSFPVTLYLIAALLPMGFTVGTLYLTAARVVLVGVIGAFLFRLIRGQFGRPLATDIFFGLHLCWVLVSLAVNNPGQMIQNGGAVGVDFLGGYILGRMYIRDRHSFVALVQVLVLAVVLCFPLAVAEALTGKSLLIDLFKALPGMSPPTDLAIEQRWGLDRVQLSFEHPIHWGLFCSLATALCFVGLKGFVDLRHRVLLTATIALCGLSALSSGAILGIALQIGLIVWAAVFRNTAKRWGILLGLFAVCYVGVDLLSNRTPVQVFMSYATFSAHSAYWRSTIFEWGMVNVWSHPLLGLGLNDWVRPVWMHTPSIDNFWLLIAMRFGLPAFASLFTGFTLALWQIGRRKIDSDDPDWTLRRAWMFCMVGVSFTLATVHIWGTIHGLVFFIFGAGMWLIKGDADGGQAPARSPVQTARTLSASRFSRFDQILRQKTSASNPANTGSKNRVKSSTWPKP